ncbi:MAG: iron-containing alcohol dehydrogenase [Pseudomonadota bacterium]
MDIFDSGRVPPMRFGAGTFVDLPDLVVSSGSPVLLVADRALGDLGIVDRAAGILAGDGIDTVIAADVAGEPKEALVDDLASRARADQCAAVIALGGGAAMDAAKLAAAIALGDKPASHYALSANPLPAKGLPAIAVPTTAGTGSEVTRTAIVSTADGEKLWHWGEEMMFSQVLLDPELTLSLPNHLTAWTGIDAVAHAVEAVTSRSANTIGRLYGLEALKILAQALPDAVADGADIEARGRMLWASTLAGLALHNCNTHMGHNISHALGSVAPVHHGLATGLALEVAWPMLVARPEGAEGYAAASAALGGPHEASALPDVFSALMRRIGIDRALPDACAGISPAALLAQMMVPHNHAMTENAPCDLSEGDLENLADQMMGLPALEKAA